MASLAVSLIVPLVFVSPIEAVNPVTPTKAAHKTDQIKSIKIDLKEVEAIKDSPNIKPKAPASSGGNVENIVRHAARTQGLNEENFLRIAVCESRLNPSVVNPAPVIVNGINYGHAKGVFQFIDSTWKRMSAQAGYEGADVFDVNANINVAAWAFAHGRAGEWACK